MISHLTRLLLWGALASLLLAACSGTPKPHATHTPLDKPIYRVFDAQGKASHYTALLQAAGNADILLFGELHNDSVIHWLQLSVTQDMASQGKPLVLGLEMLERDVQTQLDQYLQGGIDFEAFAKDARLWKNYETDYRPLVDFAKARNFPVVATNIPRRYASMVNKGGAGFAILDSLPDAEKAWIAPLPVRYDASLPQYQKMLTMGGGHANPNLPKAQAIKDATMAHSILQNLQPGSLFIHYHGTYHSDFKEGIHWYLKQERDNLAIVTIAAVRQESLAALEQEHLGKADFIIAVDSTVAKTY